MTLRKLSLGLVLLALPLLQGCTSIVAQQLLAPRPLPCVAEITTLQSASAGEEGAVVLRLEGFGRSEERRIAVPGPLSPETVRLSRTLEVNGHVVTSTQIGYVLEVSREGEWVPVESFQGPNETPWWGYALLPAAVPLTLALDACLLPVYLGGGLYFAITEGLLGG